MRPDHFYRVPVRIREHHFSSQYAAALYFNVTPSAIHYAMERGRLDFVGLGKKKAQPVVVLGVHYPSMSQASRATGINPSTLVIRFHRRGGSYELHLTDRQYEELRREQNSVLDTG